MKAMGTIVLLLALGGCVGQQRLGATSGGRCSGATSTAVKADCRDNPGTTF